MSGEVLLMNRSAGFLGNSPMFWCEGGAGYTQWVDEAQRFTKKEARDIIRSTRSSHDFKMVAVRVVEAICKRTVDMQDLRLVKRWDR